MEFLQAPMDSQLRSSKKGRSSSSSKVRAMMHCSWNHDTLGGKILVATCGSIQELFRGGS